MKTTLALAVLAGCAATTALALAVLAGCTATTALAQKPSSAFDRGHSQQSWQNSGLAAANAKCKKPPAPFSIGGGRAGQAPQANDAPPPEPAMPPPTAEIPGVIAAGQTWKVVWSWEGNNVDGPIAGDDGTMIFANNDASNVMQVDPANGLAKILFSDTNTGGAVSRSKNGSLFLASRGFPAAIIELEPQRKIFANTVNGEPLDCAGGVSERPVRGRARRRLRLRQRHRRVLCGPEGRDDAVRR